MNNNLSFTYTDNNLPFCLQLAAMTTALDNIKIKRVNYNTGIRTTIKTKYTKDWVKQLLLKSSKFLTEDINNANEKYDNNQFCVYCLGGIFYDDGKYKYVDLSYEIKHIISL